VRLHALLVLICITLGGSISSVLFGQQSAPNTTTDKTNKTSSRFSSFTAAMTPLDSTVYTDVAGVVNQLLAAHGPVPVTVQVPTQVQVEVCGPSGDPPRFRCNPGWKTVMKPQTTSKILTASNIRAVSTSDVAFGTLTKTTLPDVIGAASLELCNTGATTGSQGVTFSEQIQHTDSTTITHSVTNTLSASLGGSYVVVPGLTLNTSVQIGTSNTTSNASLSGTALSTTLQINETEPVPPQSRYAVEFLVTPTQFNVPFSATVTVDADLGANDPGLAHLSDIADQSKRTFSVDGVASSTMGLTAHTVMEPLSYPGDCVVGSGVTSKHLELKDGDLIGLPDGAPIRGNPVASPNNPSSKQQKH
jgi:hypothetical protein